MKRGLWVLVAAMVMTFVAGRAGYAFWGSEKKAAAPAKTAESAKADVAVVAEDNTAEVAEVKAAKAPAVPAVTSAQLEKQRALRDKKKALINNNQWDVEISPLSGKGAKQTDTLAFRDNKFFSSNFGKMGFAPSNYTLTVADDASVVIETMQSSEKEGIVFWRIEMDKDAALCKGILSRQLSENKTEDFSFNSTGKKPVTAEFAVPAAAAAKAPAEPKDEPKAAAKKS